MPAMTSSNRLAIAAAMALAVTSIAEAALPLDSIRLPPGFTIELVTDRVPNAREMALGLVDGSGATLFVGSQGAGKVYAVSLDGGIVRRERVRLLRVADGLRILLLPQRPREVV